jgi:hypothetical protein
MDKTTPSFHNKLHKKLATDHVLCEVGTELLYTI